MSAEELAERLYREGWGVHISGYHPVRDGVYRRNETMGWYANLSEDRPVPEGEKRRPANGVRCWSIGGWGSTIEEALLKAEQHLRSALAREEKERQGHICVLCKGRFQRTVVTRVGNRKAARVCVSCLPDAILGIRR